MTQVHDDYEAETCGIDDQKYTVACLEPRIFEVTFAPGLSLDEKTLIDLISEIQAESPDDSALVLLNVSNLQKVTADLADIVSDRARTTRVVLLGATVVDEVLAFFALDGMAEKIGARYFTERDEALAYLREHKEHHAGD